MGLASHADLQAKLTPEPAPKTFWSAVKTFFLPTEKIVPAVCIPPGASLLLMDISDELRDEMQVGRVEEVTFTQISAAANSYRDAVRFQNGREVLLQRLKEGQRIRVLALSANTEAEYITATPRVFPR